MTGFPDVFFGAVQRVKIHTHTRPVIMIGEKSAFSLDSMTAKEVDSNWFESAHWKRSVFWMFSNLIDTRYQADYRLMASSWMRNIWESHLLQKSTRALRSEEKNVNRERKSAPIRSENISHLAKRTHYMRSPPLSQLIHGRYRCREASAARDTLTGETRRSQGARESFCDLFRD